MLLTLLYRWTHRTKAYRLRAVVRALRPTEAVDRRVDRHRALAQPFRTAFAAVTGAGRIAGEATRPAFISVEVSRVR